MGLSVQPHIDPDVQKGAYAQDRELGQKFRVDQEARRAIVFDQPVSELGHLLHRKDRRKEQHLGAASRRIGSG